jgi:hypothetical protein
MLNEAELDAIEDQVKVALEKLPDQLLANYLEREPDLERYSNRQLVRCALWAFGDGNYCAGSYRLAEVDPTHKLTGIVEDYFEGWYRKDPEGTLDPEAMPKDTPQRLAEMIEFEVEKRAQRQAEQLWAATYNHQVGE